MIWTSQSINYTNILRIWKYFRKLQWYQHSKQDLYQEDDSVFLLYCWWNNRLVLLCSGHKPIYTNLYWNIVSKCELTWCLVCLFFIPNLVLYTEVKTDVLYVLELSVRFLDVSLNFLIVMMIWPIVMTSTYVPLHQGNNILLQCVNQEVSLYCDIVLMASFEV